MAQPPIPRPPGSRVEERIDHEEAKRIAEKWTHPRQWVRFGHIGTPDFPELGLLARAYLDLLTEHSAREEREKALERALRWGIKHLPWAKDQPTLAAGAKVAEFRSRAHAALHALPATEPAQPEEEPAFPRDKRNVGGAHSGHPKQNLGHVESPPVETGPRA